MLTLLSRASGKDAVRGFGKRNRDYCDGQYVSTASEMVCLFDREWAKIESPTQLKWTPKKRYEINSWTLSGPPVWMPKAPEGRYQIFLCVSSDEYVYLGPAHISVTSHGRDPWVIFDLEQKIPKAGWLQFGGRDGWQIRGDYSGQLASTELDRFDTILSGNDGHLQIALRRYEDDELIVRTNRRRGLLQYNGLRAVGELPKENAPEEFRSAHHAVNFCAPAEYALAREKAVTAARSFFTSGEFPSWLQWETPDETDNWLFREITASLQYLFGHALPDAEKLLDAYLKARREWQRANSDAPQDDQYLHTEGAEAIAYEIQWSIGLGKEPRSMAFLDWRRSDYERRKLA